MYRIESNYPKKLQITKLINTLKVKNTWLNILNFLLDLFEDRILAREEVQHHQMSCAAYFWTWLNKRQVRTMLNRLRKTYNLTFEGWELESSPITIIPFNFIFPVNGILNNNSSSASDSTYYKNNYWTKSHKNIITLHLWNLNVPPRA